MTINIPSDHSITQTGNAETSGISRGSNAVARSFGSAGDDRFSASSTASSISSSLDVIAAQRATRVAKLAQVYASGRYSPDSTGLAKSLVNGSVSVGI